MSKTGFYKGRLGIGLTSTMGMGDGNPRYPLDINGDIRLTGAIVNSQGLALNMVASDWQVDPTNNQISYSAGNVGIGTTSPGAPLEIKCITGNTNAQWDGAKGLRLARNRDGYAWEMVNGYHNDLLFRNMKPDGTIYKDNVLMLDDNGNVGIGTTTPQSKLDVVGSAVFKSVDAANTGGIVLMPDDEGTASNGNASGRIFFNETQNNVNNYGFSLGFNGGGHNDILNWKANTFNINYHNNSVIGSTVLTINRSGGYVGIGTNSPTQGKLVVYGSSICGIYSMGDYTDYNYILNGPPPGYTTGGAVHFINSTTRTGDGGGTCYTIRNDSGPILLGRSDFGTTIKGSNIILDGNVGIGTTSPYAKLQISGTSIDPSTSTQSSTSSQGILRLHGSGGLFMDFGFMLSSPYTGWIQTHNGTTNGTGDDLALQPVSGNVGIGTTSPNAKLDVNGNIFANGLIYLSDYIQHIGDSNTKIGFPSNDNIYFYCAGVVQMRINNNGVGIHTDAPANSSTRLQVGGNVSVSGKLKINSSVGTMANPENAAEKALFLSDGNNGLYVNMGTSGNGTSASFGLNWYNNNNHTDVDHALFLKSLNGFNYVGIGGFPSYTLDVFGHMRIESGLDLVWGNSNCKITGVENGDLTASTNQTVRFTVKQDGNVEIGNLSVGAIYNSDYWGIRHKDKMTSDHDYAFLVQNNGNTFINSASYQNLYFRTGNNDVMTINGNSWYVGIGTTSPGEKLGIYHGSISLSGDGTNHEKNKYGMIQIWGTGTGRIPARGIAWCSSVSVQSQYNGTTGLQYDGGATMGAWSTQFRRAGIFSEGGGYASHYGNLIFEVSNHRGRYEWGGINFEAMRIEKDGNITYSGTIGSASDNRIKHNEVPIKNALSTICKLNPLHYIKTTDTTIYDVSHNFILDSSGNPIDNSGNPVYSYAMETGIIAQDIKNIPELKFAVRGEEYKEEEKEIYKKDNSGNDLLDVSGNREIEKIIKEIKPNILTVDYNSIHCTHIAATQELNNKVERENQKLKNEVATLKAELAAIKQHLGI